MSDIVKKYQHYFAESVKLQETVNEQAAYIEELEEAVTTLSEIFDSPEGQLALGSYQVKARESLNKARKDRKRAEGDAEEILYDRRGGPEVGARKLTADEAERVNRRNQREGGPTVERAQEMAKDAFDTIQKRKRGLKLADNQRAKIDARDEARKEAEAKAKGIDRFNMHMKDATGRLVRNPYYKEREIEDIPPDFKLPTKK
jgi:hypothetical protein